MKAPDTTILEAAYAELEAGSTIKEILAKPRNKAGDTLSYSQFWLFSQRKKVAGTSQDLKGKVTPEAIAGQRNQGLSWGTIAVNCDLPESRVRKIFSEATGVRSEGLRIGAGGRFLRDDQLFYEDERRVTGTPIPTTKPVAQVRNELFTALQKRQQVEANRSARKAATAQKRTAKKAPAPAQ